MKYVLDNQEYPVEIIRKHNKNIYIRISDDLKICVTANRFVSKQQIYNILTNNEDYLLKMLMKQMKKIEQNNEHYFLGEKYDIISTNSYEDIDTINKKIYLLNNKDLLSFYSKQAKSIFEQRLKIMYDRFQEEIGFPKLKIRKMKTRWGVCNRKDNSITLNLELIKYGIDKIDYVIIHELAHFVYFDHSANFWNLVRKYIPNYKQIRKELRD